VGKYTTLILSRYYYYIPLFITNIFPNFSETILNYTHSSFKTQRNFTQRFLWNFARQMHNESAQYSPLLFMGRIEWGQSNNSNIWKQSNKR